MITWERDGLFNEFNPLRIQNFWNHPHATLNLTFWQSTKGKDPPDCVRKKWGKKDETMTDAKKKKQQPLSDITRTQGGKKTTKNTSQLSAGTWRNSKCCILLDRCCWMLRVHNQLWHQKCPFLNVQIWSVKQRSLNNSQFANQDSCHPYQHWRRTVQFTHQLFGPFSISEKSIHTCVVLWLLHPTLANNTKDTQPSFPLVTVCNLIWHRTFGRIMTPATYMLTCTSDAICEC